MTSEGQINFAVHNIYVKDISFEAPNSPHIFVLNWNPELNFDIQMAHSKVEEFLYEVIVKITVSVAIKHDEEKILDNEPAFIAEVKQAGVFMLQGVSDDSQIEYILATAAPTILFPYARQVISNLITQGGFPQLVVPPMNFDAMYQQHLADKAKESETASA